MISIPRVTLARDTLVIGDPDRDFTVYSSVDGGMGGPPRLVGNGKAYDLDVVYLCAFYPNEREFHGAARLRDGTPPGQYKLRVGLYEAGDVWVVPSQERRATYLTSPYEIESLSPYTKAILAPGHYVTERPIRCPEGVELVGYATRLSRANLVGEYHADKMFVPAPRVTLRGLTIDSPGLVFHSDDPCPEVVVDGITLYNGNLGFWGRPEGLVVKHSTFIRAGVTASTGVFWDNRFSGVSLNGHHSFIANKGERLAVIEAIFDGTDRGVSLRTSQGDQIGTLVRGITCNNISHIDNGNEITGCEGGGACNRCLFLHFRVYNCEGEINFWDATTTECLIQDIRGENTGIRNGLKAFDRNTIRDVELRGGRGVQLGTNARHNTLQNVAVRYTKTNINGGNTDYDEVETPIGAPDPTNSQINCRVI